MRRIPDKYQTGFVYLSLTIITFAVFWQVHGFEFISYDDGRYVTENTHVATGLKVDNIVWAFTGSHFFMWHPMTSLSHMLDCQLFGLNSGWHHIVNLLFHIANTLLLFTVLKQMTGRIWPSAFVAAVFALHPLNVESVVWIAERKSVLSGFFWLLTIAVYIRYTKYPRITNYLWVVFVFALALMSKPTTVTLPFALLLLDYWPLCRFRWIKQDLSSGSYKKLSTWQLVREKIPLFILSTILCVITVATQESGNVLAPSKLFPFSVRLSNALVSYVVYIGKMVYPAYLAVFYPHPGFSLPLWKPVTAFIMLAAVSACVIYLGRRKTYLIVGWLWFLGTLIPVIGLVQAGGQAMADRYAYIPLIGLFVIIVWGTNDLLTWWRYRKIVLSLASLAIISVLSVCTWRQTSYWRNNTGLFEHALRVTSGNYVAYTSLGVVLIDQGRFDEAIKQLNCAVNANPRYAKAFHNLGSVYNKLGCYDEAIGVLKQAIKLNPDFAYAYNNLGLVYGKLGRFQDEVEAYKQAIKINPIYPEAFNNLGVAYGKLGRRQDAMEACKKAIKIKPDFAEAYNNLGIIYGQTGRKENAIEAYSQALKVKDNFVQAHLNLGAALSEKGQFDQALTHLTRAVQLDPNSDKSHYYLAMVLTQKGRIDEAVTHFNDALRLKPDWVEPMNMLAWLLATHKDASAYNPQKAVQLALRACELTGNQNATVVDTLAAAYAAAGSFPDAVTSAEKALSLAKSAGDNQLTEQIQKRLDLYKMNQSYIETNPK